ncbi:MAG: GerMN domain-containing protein [Lachnospiraceae bacterium]|nr:GerMN domain-containing protein [Lachnospiraceae bacterium]
MVRRIKKTIYSLIVFTILLAMCACGRKRSGADSSFRLYYLNKDGMSVSWIPYEPTGADSMEVVNEVLKELAAQPSDFDLRPVILSDMSVNSVTLNEGLLLIDFDTGYIKDQGREEILRRAAIVRTLDQVEGVDEISITVDGTPLNDSKGQPVGIMTSDMFIDNAGDEINSYERTRLVLYFANADGNGLVQTTESVAYNSNISMEKLVTEHIISGPLSNGVYPVTDPGVGLISVTTKDGICYVNLSREFLVKQGKLTDEVVLYAFVNSLTELPNINKVQFMIDSETEISFGEHSYLSEPFERNLELVEVR